MALGAVSVAVLGWITLLTVAGAGM
jgi:hypothetical protein